MPAGSGAAAGAGAAAAPGACAAAAPAVGASKTPRGPRRGAWRTRAASWRTRGSSCGARARVGGAGSRGGSARIAREAAARSGRGAGGGRVGGRREAGLTPKRQGRAKSRRLPAMPARHVVSSCSCAGATRARRARGGTDFVALVVAEAHDRLHALLHLRAREGRAPRAERQEPRRTARRCARERGRGAVRG